MLLLSISPTLPFITKTRQQLDDYEAEQKNTIAIGLRIFVSFTELTEISC